MVAALSAGSVPRAGGRWPQCRHSVAWAQSGFARRSGRGNFETRQRENKPPHSTASASTPPPPGPGLQAGDGTSRKIPTAGSEHKLCPSVLTPPRDGLPSSARALQGSIPKALPAFFDLM